MNNNECSRDDILKLMKDLKLTGMMESYDKTIADTIRRKATNSYCLHQLLKAEVKARTIRAIAARIKVARFPAIKDLDNFIFTGTPISQEQVMQLYSTEFINTSRNIILVGGPGTGKTHLAFSGGKHPAPPPVCHEPELQTAWDHVLACFAGKYGKSACQSWLSRTAVKGAEQNANGTFVIITCPNKFIQGWLEQHYLRDLNLWWAEHSFQSRRISGVQFKLQEVKS